MQIYHEDNRFIGAENINPLENQNQAQVEENVLAGNLQEIETPSTSKSKDLSIEIL